MFCSLRFRIPVAEKSGILNNAYNLGWKTTVIVNPYINLVRNFATVSLNDGAGVYILQNTMVVGGGWLLRGKNEN